MRNSKRVSLYANYLVKNVGAFERKSPQGLSNR